MEKVHIPRTMKVVRAWLAKQGSFGYFKVYSDGSTEPTTRKEAEKYARAYSTQVETVIGEPSSNITGS